MYQRDTLLDSEVTMHHEPYLLHDGQVYLRGTWNSEFSLALSSRIPYYSRSVTFQLLLLATSTACHPIRYSPYDRPSVSSNRITIECP